MRTKVRKRSGRSRPSGPAYRTIHGKRMVVLEEAEYLRLKQKADEWEPLLPQPDSDGNYPAREYMLASIARSVIRHRRRLGLSQAELARRAGIRPETLNRIEQAKHSPSVATIEKIDRALKEAEAAEDGAK
ncbi:MAG TPA: helix-turn-helix transcriptional regulator [Gemmataceae bacterium]|nr:helix-turn-helix transcriptional regulator [Gemmataceae bacterium]